MKTVTKEQAFFIGQEVHDAVKRWGKQAGLPYDKETLLAALAIIFDAYTERAYFISPEDATKLRRQLAAANARVARLAKNADE